MSSNHLVDSFIEKKKILFTNMQTHKQKGVSIYPSIYHSAKEKQNPFSPPAIHPKMQSRRYFCVCGLWKFPFSSEFEPARPKPSQSHPISWVGKYLFDPSCSNGALQENKEGNAAYFFQSINQSIFVRLYRTQSHPAQCPDFVASLPL